VQRAPGSTLTLWSVDGLTTAHGLAWGPSAPDLRDSTVAAMKAATQAWIDGLGGSNDTTALALGEQGAPCNARDLAQAQRVYWTALETAIEKTWQAGGDGLTPPSKLPGVDEDLTAPKNAHSMQHLYHGLNWQRAWRQRESAEFAPTQ
jgi:hypothetical protein